MKKTISKTFLAIGSMAAIIAPIATTVSCGTIKKYDLTIGIRSEDQQLWNKVAEEFTKATGKTIGFKWITNQENNYKMWSENNSMPNVTLADSSWAKIGVDKGWFEQLDLADIASNKDYLVTGQDSEYVEKTDLKLDDNNFEKNIINSMQTSKNGKYNGLATIYGPKITYAWKALPGKDGNPVNLYDGKTPLEYYVPNPNGIADKVSAFDESYQEGENEILYSHKTDHHRLKNSEEDIQEFLTNSASQTDLKYNAKLDSLSYDISNDSTGEGRVLSTGPNGYLQRMASISKVIFDVAQSKKTQIANNILDKIFVGTTHDLTPSFESLAYGQKLNQQTIKQLENKETNMDLHKVMDDNKVFSKTPNSILWDFGTEENNTGESMYQKISYYSSIGYAQHGFFGNSYAIDEQDQQIGFGNLQSLFVVDGGKWMVGSIKDKFHDKVGKNKNISDYLATFGKPFQVAGVDGYAITKGQSKENELLSKEFMRFLMQKQVAASITADKAISTTKSAHSLQKVDPLFEYSFKYKGISGVINPIPAEDVDYLIAKSSKSENNLNGHDNTSVYDPYNDFWMKGSAFDIKDIYKNGHVGATLDIFKKALNIYNTKYMDTFIG